MDPSEIARRSAGVAAVFDKVAATYENVDVPWFAPIAQALVAAVAPAPGERALDIGCGTGAALFPLAAAVGPRGTVTGIDLSAAMLDRAAAELRVRGLSTVDLHRMDAGAPALPAAAYDVVVASLVIFFLPDPATAAAAWQRLLVPGGRLGISTFGHRDQAWQDLDAVFRPHLPPQLLDARTSGQAGPFASDRGVEELLAAAGFDQPRTTGFDLTVTFDGAEHWRTWSRSHGQRAMWDAVPAGHLDQIMAAAAERLAAAAGPDGRTRLTQHIRLTTALRPPQP
jgi:ubiquinone/menaquinone biosynthesis C-methylase UbiE